MVKKSFFAHRLIDIWYTYHAHFVKSGKTVQIVDIIFSAHI